MYDIWSKLLMFIMNLILDFHLAVKFLLRAKHIQLQICFWAKHHRIICTYSSKCISCHSLGFPKLVDWTISMNFGKIFARMDPHCSDTTRKIGMMHTADDEASRNE